MTINALLTSFLQVLNLLVPLLFSVALLVFLFNVVRFFIIGGADEEAQKRARQLAIWGILAFVIMLSLWGIVNLFRNMLGLSTGQDRAITPDYQKTRGN